MALNLYLSLKRLVRTRRSKKMLTNTNRFSSRQILIKVVQGSVPLPQTPCPNFLILGLSTFQMLQAYYTKMINNHSKSETISKLTAHKHICWKNLYFVNDEVRAGCPKLGHNTLVFLICQHLSDIQGRLAVDSIDVIIQG